MPEARKLHGIQIGEVLKTTRARQGLDVRTVEEQTKIRTRYLRALENEDWDVLPSNAYAKGFLRTYAQLLGLDADALVDEFRRQVEAGERDSYSVGESVLERRRRPGEAPSGPRPLALAGAAIALVVAFLLVLGLLGGGEDDGEPERRQAGEARGERGAKAGEAMTLRLVTNETVHICLVGDANRPLIDGQVVPAGTEDRFAATRFALRFPSGFENDQIDLFLDGERLELPERQGAVAFRLAGGRLRGAPEPGPGCP